MDTEQRRRSVDEIEPVKHRLRHRIIKTPRAASVDRLLHEHGEITSQEAGLLRLGVDRNDPTGLVPDQIHNRTGHLPLTRYSSHLPCTIKVMPGVNCFSRQRWLKNVSRN